MGCIFYSRDPWRPHRESNPDLRLERALSSPLDDGAGTRIYYSNMIILSIETSCDETAIALLKAEETKSGVDFEILSDQIASQVKIHAPFGGVVPNLAKREHIKNLPILLKRALKEARLPLGSRASQLDAIAVTYRPGPEPALRTGINFAPSCKEAGVDVLDRKTIKAREQNKPRAIALGGGVAANDKLREELAKKFPNILLPNKRFTGDNAAMIAVAGYYRFAKSKNWKSSKNIKATGNLRLSKR